MPEVSADVAAPGRVVPLRASLRRIRLAAAAVAALAAGAGCAPPPAIDAPDARCELAKAPGPVAEEGDSAGRRHGWRELWSDDFDQDCLAWHWNVYDGPGTYGVGDRRPEAVDVADGELRLLGRHDVIGGIAEVENRLYGKWEVRARSEPRLGYSQVVLLWPESDRWPLDGEVDFSEVTAADRRSNSITVHYGADGRQDGTTISGDFTRWHTYAVDWAPDHLTVYVDGEEVYRATDPAMIPRTPMHLCLQQDVGPLTTALPAPDPTDTRVLTMHVDWVRAYA
jgi:hypothetical protein